MDLGNYTIVALVFGQIVSEKQNTSILVLGITVAVLWWLVGFFVLNNKRRRR